MSVFHAFEKWTKGETGWRYLFVLLFFLFPALNAVGSITIHRFSNILKVRDFRKQLFLSWKGKQLRIV